MRGMSSEKPAEERFLLMDHIWSAYDVTGDVTRKSGAMCVMIHFAKDMALGYGQSNLIVGISNVVSMLVEILPSQAANLRRQCGA